MYVSYKNHISINLLHLALFTSTRDYLLLSSRSCTVLHNGRKILAVCARASTMRGVDSYEFTRGTCFCVAFVPCESSLGKLSIFLVGKLQLRLKTIILILCGL